MLDCNDASRLASDSTERKLTLREKFSLLFHLRLCPWCKGHGEDIDQLSQSTAEFAAMETEDTPDILVEDDGLPSDSRERIRLAMKRELS
ncbi:MAG: zf-HC2 domain-containing protein [Planctomycetota bacterium]